MNRAEENQQVLNLVQAMLGALTQNFRRVAIEVPSPGAVHLCFVLENDVVEDREEIADIAFEFEALQCRGIDLSIEVIVDTRPICELTLPGRHVFGRREE